MYFCSVPTNYVIWVQIWVLSIRGFKKAMGDEDDKKDQPKEQDADFAAKTLADKQQTSANKEEAKNDKQV